MCAHVWAQQTQDDGRGSTLSFEGDTLKSYHTPIARIVKRRRGTGRVLLLTSADYSVTTQHHKSIAWRAFAGETFRVPSLGMSGGMHSEPGIYARNIPDHRVNMSFLVAEYKAACLKLKRRHSLYQSVAESLEYDSRMAKGYAVAFGFKDRINVDADVAEVEAHRAKAEAKRNTPAAIAKRERDRATREVKQAEKCAAREAQRIEESRIARLNDIERIAEWLAGGARVWLSWDAQRMEDGSAMLRVKPGHPDTMQTSQSVEVPMEHARWAFEHAKRARESGEAWTPSDGRTFRVGHFTVNRIEADGSVRAGCHYIAWTEVERFATSQGW